jgi:hypothetical protein
MAAGDHVADLYAVPPAEFTATRNRVAAQLRQSGRSAEAQAVARLRKPSAALWAVNRLASTDRKGVTAFIDAVDRLRRTQLRDPGAAAEALRAQRAALDALGDRARDLLTRAGLSASQPILRRISDTLLGAAIDRARAGALRRGALSEELPAPGFEAFSGARVPAATLRLVPPRARPPAAVPAAEDAGKQRADEADRRRRALEADDLERQAAEHQRSLRQLETERAQAEAKLAELQKRLREARQTARRATAAASRARRKSVR